MVEWPRKVLTAEWLTLIVACVALVVGGVWAWWTRRAKLELIVSNVERPASWVSFDIAIISLSERADTIKSVVLRIEHSGRDYSYNVRGLVCGGHPLAFPADIEPGKSIAGTAGVEVLMCPENLTGQVCVRSARRGKAKQPITIPPPPVPA